jgi:parvulin-like peptidyl-prolyl isomerase
MKSRRSPILLALVALPVAALVAGCGGGGGSAKLASNDVAVVGQSHVTQKQFDTLMASGEQTLKAQGQKFPKQGTAEYENLKSQAVTALVQQTELNDKAKSMGISIGDKQVDKRLAQIRKQYYGGSQKKLDAAIKAQHVTLADVRTDIRNQLTDQALYNKVTKDVNVSDKAIDTYFQQNPTTYPNAASSRQVRHILVKSKSLANSIYAQVKAGGDKAWCKLAKKYSQDPSSKNNCGKLTVTKGETVPAFNAVAFGDGKTKVVHKPVYDAQQYKAYFVIEPLTDVKAGDKHPTAAQKKQIAQTLSGTNKNQIMSNWVKDLEKSYCSGTKVKYATGFQPSPDPCATLTSSTSTATTTG